MLPGFFAKKVQFCWVSRVYSAIGDAVYSRGFVRANACLICKPGLICYERLDLDVA